MAIIYSYPRRIPLASDIMLAAEISAPGEDPPVVKSFTVGQLIELIEGGGGIYAPLDSPQFTGTPYLPIGTTGVTRAISNNSTSLATTAFVQSVITAIAPGQQNLQQVTTKGNVTTTSIEANSFVKTGGTGTNVLLDNGDIVALSSIGGNTNLSTSQTATNFTINSDTGNDAVVPLGNGIDAGATLNNYTTAEQTKLAGIAPGAQVNVNADWNATSGDAQILNKPTIPSITNLVPYTGATTDVDLGLNDITAAKLIKDGGQPTQFLMADGNVTIGNGGVYSYEIHVSQIDGNDTTGTGAVLNPVASITKALTLITGLRRTIVIHPGNYTENPSITSQYTVLTTYAQLGGNTALTGTITTNTGCTISGLKMTNLTVNGVTGRGNINILSCDITGTFTKNGTADYTLVRFCDIGALNILSTAGVLAVFGGNPSFITINSIGGSILVKNAVCVSPVVLVGGASFADCIVVAIATQWATGTTYAVGSLAYNLGFTYARIVAGAGSTAPASDPTNWLLQSSLNGIDTRNAITTAPGTQIVIANSQILIPSTVGVARVSLLGFYSILNCVFDKPNSTLVAFSGTGGTTNSIVYSQFINADKFIKQGGTPAQLLAANGDSITAGTGINISGGTISSTATGVTGTGTTNYISKFTGTTAIGNSQIFDDGTNIGIGTTLPTAKLEVLSTNFPVAKITRSTALTSALRSTFAAKHLTSGDMLDGFGPDISFIIQDNSNVENEIANFGAVRDGLDNNGALIFSTRQSGVRYDRMKLFSDGRLALATDFAGVTSSPQYKLYVNGSQYLQNINQQLFFDDFNRTSVSPGGNPTIAYTLGTTGGSTATISSTQLRIPNNATTSLGYTYVTGSMPLSYDGDVVYNTILEKNIGLLTWSFNFRTGRSTILNGFGGGQFGVATILCADNVDPQTPGAKGYAVYYVNNQVYLVYFINGLNNYYNIAILNPGGLAQDYYSARVTYDCGAARWNLEVRDDGASAFSDPATGIYALQSGFGSNPITPSPIPMPYFGWLWNFGTTSTVQSAFFDNFNFSILTGGSLIVDGNIGIGTTLPNLSAKLDITSTTQGFLPPRMTTTQINAIATPAIGLVVYNTTLNVLCYRDDVGWKKVTSTVM